MGPVTVQQSLWGQHHVQQSPDGTPSPGHWQNLCLGHSQLQLHIHMGHIQDTGSPLPEMRAMAAPRQARVGARPAGAGGCQCLCPGMVSLTESRASSEWHRHGQPTGVGRPLRETARSHGDLGGWWAFKTSGHTLSTEPGQQHPPHGLTMRFLHSREPALPEPLLSCAAVLLSRGHLTKEQPLWLRCPLGPCAAPPPARSSRRKDTGAALLVWDGGLGVPCITCLAGKVWAHDLRVWKRGERPGQGQSLASPQRPPTDLPR